MKKWNNKHWTKTRHIVPLLFPRVRHCSASIALTSCQKHRWYNDLNIKIAIKDNVLHIMTQLLKILRRKVYDGA